MKRTPLLTLCLATAALAVPAASLAAPADIPTATIGSVKGTGSHGCVKTSKTVLFTLNSIDSGYFVTGARVTLDGKTISRKAWAIPAAISAPPSPTFREFTLALNLRHLAGGRHRVALFGTLTAELFGRHQNARAASTFTPRVPPSLIGSVRTSSVITKCAAFTG